jgi:hypothetical protein
MSSTGAGRQQPPGMGDTVAGDTVAGDTEGGNTEGGAIEVAIAAGSKEGSDHVITLRDPKNPDGPTLVFTPAEWEAFVAGVRDGEFDLDETGALVELDSEGHPVGRDTRGDPASELRRIRGRGRRGARIRQSCRVPC